MLLLDPRIARSPLVTSFFKVSENLIMLKAAKNMPYSSSPRVRGRTTTTSPIQIAKGSATSAIQSDATVGVNSDMSSNVDLAEESSKTQLISNHASPPVTQGLPTSVSEKKQIVPTELVALDSDNNVLHAVDIVV